jgi:ribosome biogenesis SPOUT family RNA methylase Rps3
MARFVIEHLEPRLYAWCLLEYRAISELVHPGNILFTNVRTPAQQSALHALGAVEPRSVVDMWRELPRPCLLDPAAPVTLTPPEATKFGSYIFGGILGDDPPRERTRDLLTVKMEDIPIRNLGPKQFSTDTAVRVVKKIIDGTPLERMEFQDGIEVPIRPGETVILPYRYLIEDGVPVLPRGLEELLRKRKGF